VVRAGIYLDSDRTAAALADIVLGKPFPNLGCPCPDDGIVIRIVIWRAPEHLGPDYALLQMFGMSGQSLIDDVSQELLRLFAGTKWGALEDFRKSFYPLGMPDVTNNNAPIALGMKAPGLTTLAVWRIDGVDTVELPLKATRAEILYPVDLGIQLKTENGKLFVRFPRAKMACILRV